MSRFSIKVTLLIASALILVLCLHTSPSYTYAPQISQTDLTPFAYLPVIQMPPTQLAPADVRITNVINNANAPFPFPVLREYVVIENLGGTSEDMTDWTLSDQDGHKYTFTEERRVFVLAAGATVRVWSKVGGDTDTDLYWDLSGYPVWDDDGDTAYLRDTSDALISVYSY
jgi:hypothetical protein